MGKEGEFPAGRSLGSGFQERKPSILKYPLIPWHSKMSKKRAVILIAGQLASGTTEVGQLVGGSAGLTVLNTESLFREIAAEFQASFQYLQRISRSGEVDLEKVIEGMVRDKIAEGDVVIEGRAALMGLGSKATLKVFLHKEMTERQKFLAKRREISEEEALRELQVSDQERANLVRTLMDSGWTDVKLYDLTVNTSRVGHQGAAQLVKAALETKTT